LFESKKVSKKTEFGLQVEPRDTLTLMITRERL